MSTGLKLTDLPQLDVISGEDLLLVVDVSENKSKKVSLDSLNTSFNPTQPEITF